MHTILGIDADTLRIAYCRLHAHDDGFTVHSIGSVTRREVKRHSGLSSYAPGYAVELRKVLYPILEAKGEIFLEDAFMGRNRKTYGFLSQVQGELKYEIGAVFGDKDALTVIQPSVWQSVIGKYFGLPFRGPLDTKECSMRCASKILGLVPESTHEADAACLAFFGYMRYIKEKDASNQTQTEKTRIPRKR